MPNNARNVRTIRVVEPANPSFVYRARRFLRRSLFSIPPAVRAELKYYIQRSAIILAVASVASLLAVTFAPLLIAGLFIVYWIWKNRQEQVKQNFLEGSARGRRMLTREEAVARAAGIADNTHMEWISWGNVRVPLSMLYCGALICGAIGSGKTILFRLLMAVVLPTIKPSRGAANGEGRRAIIYDHKQEMAQIIGSMPNLRCIVRIANPFDIRAVGLDLAKDIRNPAAAQQAAHIAIPRRGNETQPFFSDGARNLLAATMSWFIKHYPGQWTFREILLVVFSKRYLRRLLENDPEFSTVVENYLDCGETTLASLMATIDSLLRPYAPIAALWEHCPRKFSATEYVHSNSILILGAHPRYKTTLDRINSLFLTLATQQLLSLPESDTRLNLLLLDEAREFGKSEAVQQQIVSGRSKCCAPVLGFQDIEGMEEIYGEKIAHEITGQCGLKAILRLESPKTAEWASKLFGDREKVEIQVTNSRSRGVESTSEAFQKHTRPVVLPSEFMELPVTNRQNGLHEYCLARGVGAYRGGYTPAELEQLVPPIDRSIAGFEPAPVEWQYLRPFSQAELARLGLDDVDPEADASGESGDGGPAPAGMPPLRPLNI